MAFESQLAIGTFYKGDETFYTMDEQSSYTAPCPQRLGFYEEGQGTNSGLTVIDRDGGNQASVDITAWKSRNRRNQEPTGEGTRVRVGLNRTDGSSVQEIVDLPPIHGRTLHQVAALVGAAELYHSMHPLDNQPQQQLAA